MIVTAPTKKILMLHGFVQSGKIFRSKTGGLRKNLHKLGFELFYPTAPHIVTKDILRALHGTSKESEEGSNVSPVNLASKFNSTDGTNEIYGWYIRADPNLPGFNIEKSTLQFLHDYIVENGPFHGVIGFSQGAGLAGYLVTDFNRLLNLTKEEQPDLEFFISFSGFQLDDVKYQEAYALRRIGVPSLHVQGELDSLVTETRAMSLFEACEEDKRTLLKHPGGHFVPNSKLFITQVCNWIQMTTGDKSPTISAAVKEPHLDSKSPSLDSDLLDMIDSMGKI